METPLASHHQPIPLGEAAEPPRAAPPDAQQLFAYRGLRFSTLAQNHPLGDYLTFLGAVAEAQASLVRNLPPVKMPSEEAIARAFEHGMPPLAREQVAFDDTMAATLDALFDRLKTIAAPEAAKAALNGVIATDSATRKTMVLRVLRDEFSPNAIAEQVFVASAVHIHLARLAEKLPQEKLASVADGACPACGGPPVASVLGGMAQARNTRFACCAACGTRWHVVRVKCVLCSSTEGVHYSHIDGQSEAVRAETCDICHRYLKIFNNEKDPALDPVADDVASLALDMLVRDQGFSRGGANVALLGL